MEGASRFLKVAATRIKSDIVSWPVVHGGLREHKWTGERGKFGGLILLFSTETGELLSILNDGFLQHLRVGATYAIGTDRQARDDAEVVGLLGAGGMARSYIEALVQLRKVKRLQVYSPNGKHFEAYADDVRAKHGIEVVEATTPTEALEGADIVASMTDSMDPTIESHVMRPGIHVTTVTNWELAPDAYTRVNRMVTYRDGISEHHYTTPEDWRPQRLGGSYGETAKHESVIPRNSIHSLPDVILGRAPGRRDRSEITYFRAQGTGMQFAAVAALAYRRAKEKGLGRNLPSEWFLQDIRT
jgi:alanine dehydrogenase